jgi:hypothetical protein
MKLIIHFASKEIIVSEYSTMDINRQGEQLHVNLTNDKDDLAFNSIYDEILELLGKEKTFAITIQKEKGKATYADISVDYHLNGDVEILHFGKLAKEEPPEEPAND